MKTINLEELAVLELDKRDLVKTTGGLAFLPVAATVAIILSFVQNFSDVRHGFADGWRGTPRYLD